MAQITVSPKLLFAPPTGPIFGSTDDGASPYASVLWSSGVVTANVPVAACDVITAADAAVSNGLVGRLVKSSTPTGQNNFGQGICVACYKRGVNTYALIQNQLTGFYSEALAADVSAV